MPAAIETCTAEHVAEALRRRKQPGPTSLKQIQAALPKKLRDCEEALRGAIATGLVFEYSLVRGAVQYWVEPPAEVAYRLLVKSLSGKASSLLLKQLVKKLDVPLLKGRIDGVKLIDDLVREQRLFVYPGQPRDRERRLGVKPYDLEAHACRLLASGLAELEKLASQTAQPLPVIAGKMQDLLGRVAAGDVDRSSAISVDEGVGQHGDHAQLLLQGIRDINPRADAGDLVLVSELRQRLDFQLPKQQFDELLLGMFRARQIVLSRFDRAASVSADEREALVFDGQHYYNTVALWK